MRHIAYILFIGLFLSGCGVVRKSTTSHSKQKETNSQSKEIKIHQIDSLIQTSEVQIDTTKVKAAKVEAGASVEGLQDSFQLLQRIIDQLNYELMKAKVETGTKAGVELKLDKDTKKLYVKGTCDSSEILSLRKSNKELRVRILEMESQKSDTTSRRSEISQTDKEVKTRGFSFWNMLLCGIVAFVLGIIVTIIFKNFRFL